MAIALHTSVTVTSQLFRTCVPIEVLIKLVEVIQKFQIFCSPSVDGDIGAIGDKNSRALAAFGKEKRMVVTLIDDES